MAISIDCIADLHGNYPDLEGGDILIVAGDLTATDHPAEYLKFFIWFDKQKYKHRILIAGNHDNVLKEFPPTYGTWHYLCDSGVELEGIKFWGSPWTTRFNGINPRCCAFTVANDQELAEKWTLIPDDTQVLITHSPSFGNLDITKRGESVGSLSLWMMMLVIKPKIHVFGHIHESYGKCDHYNGIKLVNASHVNDKYQPINKPIRIEV